MDLEGSLVAVTGAASGLGAAVAERLAADGATVLGVDLRMPPQRRGVIGAVADVRDADAVAEALDAAVAAAGTPLRGLVTCAGVIHGERVLGREGPHDLDAFRRVIDINLAGTFNAVRLAAARMAAAEPAGADGERGVVVMTASAAAFDGQIGQAAYAASKGAVAAMTLPLARELGRSGIRVVAVAPGVFETPMFEAVPAEARAAIESTIPFPGRLGRPEEFAGLVASAFGLPYLNGEVVRLDGGLRLSAR